MLDFKPPKENAIVIGTAKLMLPLLMRLSQKVSHLDIDATSLNRLKSTEGFSTILVPNHPTHADPHVMFAVSKRCGERFRYMTARETFDQLAGGKWRGFFMTRLGAYSIRAWRRRPGFVSADTRNADQRGAEVSYLRRRRNLASERDDYAV